MRLTEWCAGAGRVLDRVVCPTGSCPAPRCALDQTRSAARLDPVDDPVRRMTRSSA